EGVAGVDDGALDALDRFLHRGLREPDDGGLFQPAVRDVDLELARVRVDTDQNKTLHLGKHGACSLAEDTTRCEKTPRRASYSVRRAAFEVALPSRELPARPVSLPVTPTPPAPAAASSTSGSRRAG